MQPRIKVIINPKAGNSSALKKWGKLKSCIEKNFRPVSCQFTQKASEATIITRNAIKDGFETIVAVGGDGTINEVVNGFFVNPNPENGQTKLGIIPMGTGGDFIKTINIPNKFEDAIHKIKAGVCKRFDVGKIQCQGLGNKPVERYFINVAEAGFGGLVVKNAANRIMPFNRSLFYLAGLLRTLFVYKNKTVSIKIDDNYSETKSINDIVIANAQYLGGGMWIAPDAMPDDGFLNIVIIGDLTRIEAILNIHKLYNGTLATHKKVTVFKGKKIILDSEEEVLIDCDGELIGKLPAAFSLEHNQINIIV